MHSEFRHDPLLVDQGRAAAAGVGASAHVHHRDVTGIVHQLKQIPIAAEDSHPPALVGGAVGQGAEHVISLEARRQAEGQLQLLAENLLELIQVLKEDRRRFVAVGLVVGIGLVPESRFRRVEGDRHSLGREGLAVLQQGLEESVGDAGGDSILRGQSALPSLAEGIEASEGQGVAIHQQQQGFVLGRAHR